MNEPKHTPTPEEIKEACTEYRKGWSEAEHRRRAGQKTEHWEVPQVKVAEWRND